MVARRKAPRGKRSQQLRVVPGGIEERVQQELRHLERVDEVCLALALTISDDDDRDHLQRVRSTLSDSVAILKRALDNGDPHRAILGARAAYGFALPDLDDLINRQKPWLSRLPRLSPDEREEVRRLLEREFQRERGRKRRGKKPQSVIDRRRLERQVKSANPEASEDELVELCKAEEQITRLINAKKPKEIKRTIRQDLRAIAREDGASPSI